MREAPEARRVPIDRVAREKKREFRDEEYWGRPVPGFGDPNASLVVVGLAPAAHGSNRTGRVFTGDRSAAFLVRGLFESGFASQPTSVRRGDGLRYDGAYITAAVRCVPPDNRPRPRRLERCRPYLEREAEGAPESPSLPGPRRVRVGRHAAHGGRGGRDRDPPKLPFAHGLAVPLGPSRPIVWASYHPSPQNTNTGRLTREMFVGLLRQIRGSWGNASTA